MRERSTAVRLLVLVAIVALDPAPASRFVPAPSPAPPREAAGSTPRLSATAVHAAVTRLPLRFEANAGQYDDQVRFVTRGAGGATLFLTEQGMTFVLRAAKAPLREHDRSRDRRWSHAREEPRCHRG